MVPIVSPPVADGGVLVERDRILAVGPWAEIRARADALSAAGAAVTRRDAGDAALMPGLVNAHTHLELSWLHGRVPPAASLPAWVRASMALRREPPDPTPAILRAIADARACGTSALGDIANGWATLEPLAASDLRSVVFHELLGFDVDAPCEMVAAARERALDATGERVRVSLAAHAAYSTSPALIREIALAVHDLAPGVMSMHVAESRDEGEFLARGSGAWRDLLDAVGRWNPSWTPPGMSPVAYLDHLGVLTRHLLVVHATQCEARDFARIAAAGATVVTCPRSNLRVGVGVPPVAAMVASGARLAVGTDSLASNDDLSVFSELHALRDMAPDVAARCWLEAATIGGARALRLDDELGTLEAGKRADVLRVALCPVPAAASALEEQLVSGITPDRLEWSR